jgi:serine/threonine-protein kinase RsbW
MSQQQESLTVPGRYDRIQEVCLFVSDGAAQAGFNEDMLFRMELCTDEACTNVIEHAYGGEDEGILQVSWRIEADTFVIEIRDFGRPFDPEKVPTPSVTAGGDNSSSNDLEATIQLKVGGLGLYFIRELMDGVTFEFDDNHGNKLTMRKRLPAKRLADSEAS